MQNKTWACTVAMGHVHQIQDPITGIYEMVLLNVIVKFIRFPDPYKRGKIIKHNQVRENMQKVKYTDGYKPVVPHLGQTN